MRGEQQAVCRKAAHALPRDPGWRMRCANPGRMATTAASQDPQLMLEIGSWCTWRVMRLGHPSPHDRRRRSVPFKSRLHLPERSEEHSHDAWLNEAGASSWTSSARSRSFSSTSTCVWLRTAIFQENPLSRTEVRAQGWGTGPVCPPRAIPSASRCLEPPRLCGRGLDTSIWRHRKGRHRT